ncbi:hypothetical protein ACQEU6_42200 [Spirillospora sp. CA-108201]
MTGRGGRDGGRDERPGTEIIGVAPFGRPAPRLAVAVARAGGTGVLDLGADRTAGLAALADVGRWWTGPFGVRVPAGCRIRPNEVPEAARTVLVDAPVLVGPPAPGATARRTSRGSPAGAACWWRSWARTRPPPRSPPRGGSAERWGSSRGAARRAGASVS